MLPLVHGSKFKSSHVSFQFIPSHFWYIDLIAIVSSNQVVYKVFCESIINRNDWKIIYTNNAWNTNTNDIDTMITVKIDYFSRLMSNMDAWIFFYFAHERLYIIITLQINKCVCDLMYLCILRPYTHSLLYASTREQSNDDAPQIRSTEWELYWSCDLFYHKYYSTGMFILYEEEEIALSTCIWQYAQEYRKESIIAMHVLPCR